MRFNGNCSLLLDNSYVPCPASNIKQLAWNADLPAIHFAFFEPFEGGE